jgi:hypothetical protein
MRGGLFQFDALGVTLSSVLLFSCGASPSEQAPSPDAASDGGIDVGTRVPTDSAALASDADATPRPT